MSAFSNQQSQPIGTSTPRKAEPITIQNHQGESQKVWSTAQYLEADPLVRQWISTGIEELEKELQPGRNGPTGVDQINHICQTIFHKALIHQSLSARMNLYCLGAGFWETADDIDNSNTRDDGPEDWEVNTEVVRRAKIRIVETLANEVEGLSTKEMENLIIFTRDLILSSMIRTFDLKRELGWYRSGNERDPCADAPWFDELDSLEIPGDGVWKATHMGEGIGFDVTRLGGDGEVDEKDMEE